MKLKEMIRAASHGVPDRFYLAMKYRHRMGRLLNLKHPTTYTEKLQWLKLYDRKPLYTTLVDKYAVKQYVAEKLGEAHVIPLIGVWDDVAEIDFEGLPDQFVMKCTHDSGGLVICKDKSCLDVDAAKRKISKTLKQNFYWVSREWPYKQVRPRVIVEKYMQDTKTGELRDYKFFVFNGVAKVMYIATGRGTGETYGDFFDMEFNHLDMEIDHKAAPVIPEKPLNFEAMRQAAETLATGIPQVRVDFYEIDGAFYFGEMTFFHCGGFAPFPRSRWTRSGAHGSTSHTNTANRVLDTARTNRQIEAHKQEGARNHT